MLKLCILDNEELRADYEVILSIDALWTSARNTYLDWSNSSAHFHTPMGKAKLG